MLAVDIKPVVIPKIDIHLTHLCNLHCDQCSHFSDYHINEHLTVEELKHNYSLWHKKIIPKYFTITGGEPLLNPDVEEMIEVTKFFWPYSNLRLYSNGLLLHKFPNLPKLLKKHNIHLIISNHSSKNSSKYDELFSKVDKLVNEWISNYGIRAQIDYFHNEYWMKFYYGYGKTMKPFNDNNIKESWNNCPVNQECFQLLDGNIFKCAPLAYLPKLDKKFGLSSEWNHYLSYKPLEPQSSSEEIVEFFNKKEESFCSMCPSKEHPFIPENNPLKIFDIKLIS